MSASPASVGQPDQVKPACPVAGEAGQTRAALQEIDESVAAQTAGITAKLPLPCRVTQAADHLEAWLRKRRGGTTGRSHQVGTDNAR